MSLLDIALFYASKGIDVFPLQAREKIPYKGFEWDKLATHDPEQIRKWFTETYKEANIGIACGARSGIVVLDIDADHGGIETLAALEDVNERLPDTPRAKTGGGGYHYIFRHPGQEVRNSASKVGGGIDVRGDGGYIVAPPSIHPNGKRYQWDEDYKPSTQPLADMPAWLLGACIANKQEPIQQANQEAQNGDRIPSGQRNQTLTSLAGTMRKRGMSTDAILSALLAENNLRCVPPLPDSEIVKIAKSVERYDQHEPEQRGIVSDVEWTFAAAAYADAPTALRECNWLKPFHFTEKKIKAFWNQLTAGVDRVQAATDAGILSDLLAWQMRTNPAEVVSYASQIARLAYLTKVGDKLAELSHHIGAGEIVKVQTTLAEMAGLIPYSGKDPLTAVDAAEQFSQLLKSLKGRSIKTGLPQLDEKTGGLERQTMSIIAARPSMGKSTLAWQIARNVAASGQKVIFFSLEMSAASLIAKAVCGICGLSWVDVRSEKANPNQMERLAKEAGKFGERYGDCLMIDDGANTTDTIWQIAAKHNPDLIVIDHLRLVGDKHENEVWRLGYVSQRMKDLAKKLNCHVQILAQLNRETERRDNKRPQMSDLRDSGQIEENADLIMMLHREDYYDDASSNSDTEVLIRKFRDGEMNRGIILKFDKGEQWFN